MALSEIRDMIYAYKNGCLSRVELWFDDVNIQSQSAVPKERCGYLLLLFARWPAGHNGAAMQAMGGETYCSPSIVEPLLITANKV
jgi:hypothetical protein